MNHHNALLDTCLEEGQFEAAISILSETLGSSYRTTITHFRQILYIALYPSPPVEPKTIEPLSPSKVAKQNKQPLFPLPAATNAARNLLRLVHTKFGPEVLGNVLPSSAKGLNTAEVELDSAFAKEAACISSCESCWEFLKEGFIKHRKLNSTQPKRSSGRGKKVTAYDSDGLVDAETLKVPNVVGESAWEVLDWLLVLFERDELHAQANGLPLYSNILLSQMPKPRGAGPVWEAEAPLDVVFFCLQRDGIIERRMGIRLLRLLVNLTSTNYIDTPIIVKAVLSRLSSSSIGEILRLIPPSFVGSKFKLQICQKFIADILAEADPVAYPKPRARARPKAGRRVLQTLETSPANEPEPASILSKYPIPTSAEIKRLSEPRLNVLPGSIPHQVYSELLVAYAIVQTNLSKEEQDPEWASMIRDEKWLSTVRPPSSSSSELDSQLLRDQLRSLS